MFQFRAHLVVSSPAETTSAFPFSWLAIATPTAPMSRTSSTRGSTLRTAKVRRCQISCRGPKSSRDFPDLDVDPLTSVSGIVVLLISGSVVLLFGCICVSFCICCRCLRPVTHQTKGALAVSNCLFFVRQVESFSEGSADCAGGAAMHTNQFCPPSPPKIPLPSTASVSTPRKQM